MHARGFFAPLRALPTGFSCVFNRAIVCCERHQIDAVPPSIAVLSKLAILRLGGNRFTDLPPALSELASLKELRLRPSPALRTISWRLSRLCETLEVFDLGEWPTDLTIVYVRWCWRPRRRARSMHLNRM